MTFSSDPSGQLGKLAGSLSPSSALAVPPPPPTATAQEPGEAGHLYSTSTSPRLAGLKQLDYGAGPSGSGGYGSPSALMGYSSPLAGSGDLMPAGGGQSSGGGVVTKQEAFGLDPTAQQQQQQAAATAASLAEFNQATSKGHEILSQVQHFYAY